MRDEGRRRAWQGGLAASYLLLVAYWSAGIGFNAAPDEYSHFFLVEYLLAHGSLPHQWIDPAVPFRGVATGAPYHARVFWYYGMPNIHAMGAAATAYAWIDLAGLPASPLAVRAFNWFLSIPFVLSLVSIARRSARIAAPAGDHRITATLAALLVATIPQVVFVFAYFNSDAFGLTALALTLALLLGWLERPTARAAIAWGAASGLLLCAKIYFLPAFALMTVLAITFFAEKRWWPARSTVTLGIGTALVVAAPILVATWAWYGDATGMVGQRDFARLYGGDPKFMRGTCFVLCGVMPVDFPMLWWWLSLSFKSFFYDLGWLDVVLPVRAYQLFFLPLCLSLVAASVAVLRTQGVERRRWSVSAVVGFWVLLLLLIAANLAGSQRLLPQPQGRYLYAILPFIPLLVGVTLDKPRTGRTTAQLLPLALAVMLILDGIGAAAMRKAPPQPIESSPGFREGPSSR